MIALFAVLIILILGALAAGLWIARITGWPDQLNDAEDRFAAASWVGLFGASSAMLAVAVFVPVKPWMVLVLFGPLAIGDVRRSWAGMISRRPIYVPMLWLAVAVAFVSSGPERLYDAALYHNQAIRWIADFGIVPGLALIHYRLSFASSWFAAGALFDQAPWESRFARSINGVVIMLLLFQFVQAIGRASRREATGRDWYLVIGMPFLLSYAQLEGMIVSASPNLGAAAAIFVAGWLLLESASPLAMVLAGGAFAIKLNAAVVGLVALGRFRMRVFLLTAALACPLLLANFRAAGCPVFPAPVFCAETAAGVGRAAAEAVTTETRSWARSGGKSRNMPLWEFGWLERWLTKRWAGVLLPPMLLALGAHLFYRRWTRAASLGTLGFLYYLTFASDHRFGFGYIVTLIAAGAGISVRRLPLPLVSTTGWAMVVASGLVAIGLASEQLGHFRNADPRLAFDARRLLLPAAGYRHAEPVAKQTVNDVELWRSPVDDRCGTLPVPCAPSPPNPSLHLCDPAQGYRGGFCRKVD